MPLTIVELIVLILATGQVVETYRHGLIFATLRAIITSRGDWWSDLFGCGFCLSHWVAFGLVVWYAWSAQSWPSLVILALAVTRGSQLLNDYSHRFCRTPNRDDNHTSTREA